ncbi:hypothetical protein FRC20_002703 [Serendipita sp. 405]|nr:hypothetical protein FRC20_002703 [Serendipita sp. 405]
MRQANPRDPRLPKNHSYITDLWNTWKEDPDFIQDVAKWEGGSYHFPENTSTSKEICKMGVRIGWLVRMWYLFEGHKTSEIVDENWPTLTVHMRELAEEMRDRPIESDVTARWETVMEKSHAAILVFKADRGQIDSDETFKLLNKIRTKVFKDKKPFIAVGTHLDTHSLDPANPDWTNKDAESLFRPLWFDESAAIVPKRVVLVSNKLYASAPVVIKRIKENIWAYEKLAEGEGMAAMHSYMPPERAKKAWHKENPSDVTQSMDEYIKDSRFQIAASRIRLLSMSAFKGQIRAPLSELELKLNSLKSSYSCVLDVACQKAETLDYYKKKYDEFAQKTSEFCQIWWHRQSGFAFSEMKEIQKLAWAAKEEVIASFIAGVDVIIQESKFSVSSDVITIPDSESASAFITAIETKLRTILDSTQEYYLETARKQLELAWEERLNELGQYFDQSNDRGDGDAITPPGISTFLNYIRSGITAKLKGVSLSTSTIGDILSSLIDRRMAEMGTEVRAGDTGFLYARQLAETTYRKGEKGDARRRTAIVRYMTGFNIKALEDIGRLTETQPDEELPRETFRPHPASIRADTVNVVGVLIRPAVNATSNSSSTDLYSWDFLSTPPKEEIHVSKMLIIKTYTTEIIEQWHGIMENEWLDSSDGVIELCSSIGLSIVRDDFEKRRKVLTGKMEDQEKALLGLQTLILAQANCAALSSAVEQLVHECSTEDLDSVEILEEKSSTQQ